MLLRTSQFLQLDSLQEKFMKIKTLKTADKNDRKRSKMTVKIKRSILTGEIYSVKNNKFNLTGDS